MYKMKKVNVELTGITPLLMNSPQSMIKDNVEKQLQTKTKNYDLEEEAKKLAYVKKNGE
ncbi:hypothetical protein LCGC14_0781090 [marine sediment metagenome]|uniref:Uncharacterized protein n=1 Tax=marine sediment metagenome TaxID=412755 RepID=A0A0F9SFE3_9ZZZZ